MAERFIELAEEFKIPRWSEGFWGSRFFGTTGGLLMDMLAEGAATGIGAQYLYDFSALPFDEGFDQPLDALVSLGDDAMRPWYPGEAYYASLRPRLRAKWNFWTGSPYDGLVEEFEVGLAATGVRVKTPRTGWGRTEVASSATGVNWVRAMPLPRNTLPAANTRLQSISIRVGDAHAGGEQFRLAVYQGGTLADSNGANLIRDFGVTSGAETDAWLTLLAADETIDPSEVLWLAFKGDGGASLNAVNDTTPVGDFDLIAGRRQYATSADPDVGFPASLASASSTSGFWYNIQIETSPPPDEKYWSRFWVTIPTDEHPITGAGVLMSVFQIGVDALGPAGLTPEYNQLLRSIARRYKPVQWVPWDFRFQLGPEEYINLQGLPRFEDPEYVYHQV